MAVHPAKKRQRGDTRRLFSQLLHVKPAVARQALMERGEVYMRGVELLVDMLTERIRARKPELRPVYQKRRMDPSSRKVRKISVLSIEQLLLDHVAVAGLSELGLQVKPSWQVWEVEVRHPVDMMGFRFSAYRTTLRKRVFKAARRVLLRAARRLERGGYMGLRCAFRLASYNGYTAATDCHMFLERVGARFLYNKAFKKISHGKGKIHKGAGAGADSEA